MTKPPDQSARITAATLGRPTPPRGVRDHDTLSDLELALDKLACGGSLHREIDGHVFTFIATNRDDDGGVYNDYIGRRLYCVVCSTCEKLVHEATVAPIEDARTHVQETIT
jgi:hypothetical protein